MKIKTQYTQLLVAIFLSLFLSNTLYSQTKLDINAGDKVSVLVVKNESTIKELMVLYVTESDMPKKDYLEIEGKFESFDEGVLNMSQGLTKLKFYNDTILMINKEGKKGFLKPVIIGGFVGGIFGGILAVISNIQTKNDPPVQSFFTYSKTSTGQDFIAGLIVGGIMGSAVGGTVGLINKVFKREKWESVYIKPGFKK